MSTPVVESICTCRFNSSWWGRCGLRADDEARPVVTALMMRAPGFFCSSVPPFRAFMSARRQARAPPGTDGRAMIEVYVPQTESSLGTHTHPAHPAGSPARRKPRWPSAGLPHPGPRPVLGDTRDRLPNRPHRIFERICGPRHKYIGQTIRCIFG